MQCTSIACIIHDPAKGNMRRGGAHSYFGLFVTWELLYRNAPSENLVRQITRPLHARFSQWHRWAELEDNLRCLFYWLVLAVWNNKERYVKTPAYGWVLNWKVLSWESRSSEGRGFAFVKHALPFHFCLSSSFNHERIIREACSMQMHSHFLQVVMQTY